MNSNLKLKILILKFKTFSFLVIALTFSFFVFSFNSPAQAQTPDQDTEESIDVPDAYNPERGVNLTLSPVFLTLSVDPGETVTSSFKVTNNNDFAEYLQVSLVKIEANQAGTNPVISDIEEGDEFASWVEYTPGQFILNPNQEQTIRITISPPDTAALGYYYGFVVGRLGQAEIVDGGGTAITASAAISLLLNVNSPNAKREIQILDFTTDKLFYEYLPTTFNVRVKNTGNIHVVPFGEIFIDSLVSREVAVLPANTGLGNVLPDIERTFTVTWDDAFAVRVPKEENGVQVKDDNGNLVYETKFDFSKANLFRFGKYTANLIMVYDNGERDVPIEATVTFWVIPWKIIGVGTVVLILALVGLRSTLLPVWRKIRKR